MSKIGLCKAEVGMNGPFSKQAEYLNCNDQLTDGDQKHVNSTAGHLQSALLGSCIFLVSLVVPEKPARLQHFSFQSVICFLFRLKCSWFGVTQKFGEKSCERKYPDPYSTLAFI